MSYRHYHTPVTPNSERALCPVCHKAVYSHAGIHPQCAMTQADPPREGKRFPDVTGRLLPEFTSDDRRKRDD